jgi:hypothetical protein
MGTATETQPNKQRDTNKHPCKLPRAGFESNNDTANIESTEYAVQADLAPPRPPGSHNRQAPWVAAPPSATGTFGCRRRELPCCAGTPARHEIGSIHCLGPSLVPGAAAGLAGAVCMGAGVGTRNLAATDLCFGRLLPASRAPAATARTRFVRRWVERRPPATFDGKLRPECRPLRPLLQRCARRRGTRSSLLRGPLWALLSCGGFPQALHGSGQGARRWACPFRPSSRATLSLPPHAAVH